MPITEQQLQLLQNVISAFIGAGGSMGVQWLSKRKTKFEKSDDHTEVIVKASSETVKATQEVILMLQGMMDKQEEHFKEEIEKAKISCNREVENLRLESTSRIEALIADNEALNIQITNLLTENKKLHIDLATARADNKTLDSKVEDLTRRLSRYEKGNTGKLKLKNEEDNSGMGE